MVKTLTEISEWVEFLIERSKSTSEINGKRLRKCHYQLGRIVSKLMRKDYKFRDKKVAVIIMMRAGLPFGLGVADSVKYASCVDVFFTPVEEFKKEDYDLVIIADAVINTGKTLIELIDKLKLDNYFIATNVISEKYLDSLEAYPIYATRISQNSFKGDKVSVISNGKGPDTGDRLFQESVFID